MLCCFHRERSHLRFNLKFAQCACNDQFDSNPTCESCWSITYNNDNYVAVNRLGIEIKTEIEIAVIKKIYTLNY